MVGESIPSPFSTIDDLEERSRMMDEFGELRKHLFEQHLKTLSSEQQQALRDGRHPSQDHKLTLQAKRFADALAEKLKVLPCVHEVSVANYHFNRNVINVYVVGVGLLDPKLFVIPDFFEGFEVHIVNRSRSLHETHPNY